jgi:dihydropyrimidinase
VSRRGLPLPRFAALAGGQVARALGLWPRKGSLLPGADADLVVIDPERSGTVRLADLHTVDYSIWEGYAYHGAPVATVYAGQVVVADGEYVGPEIRGRYVARPQRGVAAAHAA